MTITVNINDQEKLEMIRFLINKMYDETYFNVSTLRAIYKLIDINICDLDIYNILLSPMHCVDWNEIPQVFKNKIHDCVAPWIETPKVVEVFEEYDILHLV